MIVSNYSVITDKCIKDMMCIEVCPMEAIHPTTGEPGFAGSSQLFIDPENCTSCGSCISVCESQAIFDLDDLPDQLKHFTAINAAFYKN